MKTSELSILINGKLIGSPNIEVLDITSSAPHKTKDSVFVAIKGATNDGHKFTSQAIECGSVCLIVEDPSAIPTGATGIVVADTRRAWSKLCAHFSDYPAEKMTVIGVTGTSGKTTINGLIHDALVANGLKTLRVGTIGAFSKDVIDDPDTLTSPDAQFLHKLLRKSLDQKVTHATFETSSHALSQCRVEDLEFDVGVFTNLSRDHLDYHKTMESYEDAKWRLFELVHASNKKTNGAVVNVEDPVGVRYAQKAKTKGFNLITYGRGTDANLKILSHDQNIKGSLLILEFKGEKLQLRTPLIGNHNGENLAAALGALTILGMTPKDAAAALESIPPVSGRLEPILGSDIGCYVDYAHKPDALEKVLIAVRPLLKENAKLWTIFGCGGDRDRGKRPMMGEIAVKYSDKAILTSDNPRTEDPKQIFADILSGGIKPWLVEQDRRAAIHTTIKAAAPGDVVLIAGKGHENYQIIGKDKIHFSDQEVAREALAGRK